MTTQIEALKMALEALELCNGAETVDSVVIYTDKEITAIKEALAQPEQEPVAWFTTTPIEGNGNRVYYEQVSKQYNGTPDTIPLYTTPPQRTWVDLTQQETRWIVETSPSIPEAIAATRQKLKEKNA